MIIKSDYKISTSNDVVKSLLQNMKNTRKKMGITQSQLSSLTGIEQGAISKIETGKFNPSLLMLKRISDALGKELVIKLV